MVTVLPVNWTVVGLAALAGGASLGSAQVVAWLVAGDASEPSWSLLYLATAAAAFALTGAIAGWRRPDTPLLHGAVAGVGAYVLVGGLSTARQLSAGESVAWSVVPALVLVACCCGAAGGLAAEWAYRRLRRRRRAVG